MECASDRLPQGQQDEGADGHPSGAMRNLQWDTEWELGSRSWQRKVPPAEYSSTPQGAVYTRSATAGERNRNRVMDRGVHTDISVFIY